MIGRKIDRVWNATNKEPEIYNVVILKGKGNLYTSCIDAEVFISIDQKCLRFTTGVMCVSVE